MDIPLAIPPRRAAAICRGLNARRLPADDDGDDWESLEPAPNELEEWDEQYSDDPLDDDFGDEDFNQDDGFEEAEDWRDFDIDETTDDE